MLPIIMPWIVQQVVQRATAQPSARSGAGGRGAAAPGTTLTPSPVVQQVVPQATAQPSARSGAGGRGAAAPGTTLASSPVVQQVVPEATMQSSARSGVGGRGAVAPGATSAPPPAAQQVVQRATAQPSARSGVGGRGAVAPGATLASSPAAQEGSSDRIVTLLKTHPVLLAPFGQAVSSIRSSRREQDIARQQHEQAYARYTKIEQESSGKIQNGVFQIRTPSDETQYRRLQAAAQEVQATGSQYESAVSRDPIRQANAAASEFLNLPKPTDTAITTYREKVAPLLGPIISVINPATGPAPFLARSISPEFKRGESEFLAGVGVGGYEKFREEPLTAGASLAIGAISGAAVKGATLLPKVGSFIISKGPTIGKALDAAYTGSVAIRTGLAGPDAYSMGKELGGILTTEAIPMYAGVKIVTTPRAIRSGAGATPQESIPNTESAYLFVAETSIPGVRGSRTKIFDVTGQRAPGAETSIPGVQGSRTKIFDMGADFETAYILGDPNPVFSGLTLFRKPVATGGFEAIDLPSGFRSAYGPNIRRIVVPEHRFTLGGRSGISALSPPKTLFGMGTHSRAIANLSALAEPSKVTTSRNASRLATGPVTTSQTDSNILTALNQRSDLASRLDSNISEIAKSALTLKSSLSLGSVLRSAQEQDQTMITISDTMLGQRQRSDTATKQSGQTITLPRSLRDTFIPPKITAPKIAIGLPDEPTRRKKRKKKTGKTVFEEFLPLPTITFPKLKGWI